MIKIFEGENTFLSKQRLDEILEKKDSSIAIKIFDADSTDISQIIHEYETQDIFCPKKIIVLKRLLSNKQYKELVEKIHSVHNEIQDTDIIIWEEMRIPKTTRYYKMFQKINAIESFPKFNKRSFATWATTFVKDKRMEIERNAFQSMLALTNYDPNIFVNEIEKFELMGKKNIVLEDLGKNIHDSYNNSIWEFIDAINEKQNQKTYTKILLNLLSHRIDPHYLMIMIARNIKQLLLVNKLIAEGKDSREMVSILKIPPFTLPKLKSIAQKSSYAHLLKIYEKIYNLNYETKVGNIDPELGLILLTTRLN